MKIKKKATIIVVPFIPRDRSGIGMDVPLHVRIEYIDSKGRRCCFFPQLKEGDLNRIRALPDWSARQANEKKQMKKLRVVLDRERKLMNHHSAKKMKKEIHDR